MLDDAIVEKAILDTKKAILDTKKGQAIACPDPV
jgi:hypothetical protein